MIAATDLISSLGKHYIHSETAVKRQIVSSVFPSGLVYGEKKVRTLELNKVMSRILSIDKAFRGPKKRKHTNFGMLSLRVVSAGERTSFAMLLSKTEHDSCAYIY